MLLLLSSGYYCISSRVGGLHNVIGVKNHILSDRFRTKPSCEMRDKFPKTPRLAVTGPSFIAAFNNAKGAGITSSELIKIIVPSLSHFAGRKLLERSVRVLGESSEAGSSNLHRCDYYRVIENA